jgi:hypothetical protein
LGWALLVGVVALMLTFARSHGEPADATAEPSTPVAPPLRFVAPLDVDSFLRGNIHTHSAMSDGDSPAEVVFAWYREHGYDFLALTDHNRALDVSKFRRAERDDFLLLVGEEVTMAASGRSVHINALCTERTIGGRSFKSRIDAIQWAVDQINAQGGVAMINHPNFLWSLETEHIAPITGAHLLDIYNGHPSVNSDGDGERRSVEAMWDELLSKGSTLGPAGVDDMHMLSRQRTEGVPRAHPATGWIEVFGAELSRSAVCDAMATGQLYASSGAQLDRLRVADDTISLWPSDRDAKVEFIGPGGEVLSTLHPDGEPASYHLLGHERYVRARVTSAAGRAWTNAYRTAR